MDIEYDTINSGLRQIEVALSKFKLVLGLGERHAFSRWRPNKEAK